MKKIVVMFLLVSILVSGMCVSFGASEITFYSESNEEIIQAEIHLNKIVAQIKGKELKEIANFDLSCITDENQKSEIQNKRNEKIKTLEKINSYKDIKYNKTFEEVEKTLKGKNFSINNKFAALCKEIYYYRELNPSEEIKEVVKHFNSKAGLVEKPEKEILVKVSYGIVANALSYNEWTTLTLTEKLLIAYDPVAALKTDAIKQTAFNWTSEKFGKNGLGDKSDGYRHAIWNALMTRDISGMWAELYATAHEDKSQEELQQKDLDGYYKYQHKEMDLHNNQVGRDQVAWYEIWPFLSDDTIKSRISVKLTNRSSDIIWLHE